MRFARTAGHVGLALLLGIGLFVLTQLVRKAGDAYAGRLHPPLASAGVAAPALPPAGSWRLALFFDRNARGQAALGPGWSSIEPGSGVWSTANLAVVRLPPVPAGPADVALQVEAFIAPTIPAQRVRAKAGRRTLGEWRIDEGGVTTLHFPLPEDVRGPGGLELQLELPDADSPARRVAGASDVRRLAVKLHRLVVSG
jgi:hypothetical protein